VADLAVDGYVVITNPITQDRSVMRRSLLSTGLEVVAANLRFRNRVEVFEIGKVFLQDRDRELPEEPRRLSIVMTGSRAERHWLAQGGHDLDFFDVKGVVERLLRRLQMHGVQFEAGQHPTFQPGRTARLRLGERDLGAVGEVHPAVRQAWELGERRVAAADLDLEALLALAPATRFVEPISAYPAVLQDIAVIVDEEVPASRVGELLAEAGGFLLKGVQLFDVYRGDPVPPGRKSLAFGLTFQAPDKTLSDKIVGRQVERIVSLLKEALGAELRG
jgi:phenylalanyl-tRNA synthetase beta chain